MIQTKREQVGANAKESIQVKAIVQKYKTSSICWWLYGWQKGGWKLVTGTDNREKIHQLRDYHESKGRVIRIYGCNIRQHSSKIVYETPEKTL